MAFLSVRLPQSVRNRVKAVAAQRGERLQDLVAGLIERFLEEAERHPPELGDVLHRLRGLEPRLRASGVAALWVFGSVARGEVDWKGFAGLRDMIAPRVCWYRHEQLLPIIRTEVPGLLAAVERELGVGLADIGDLGDEEDPNMG